MDATKRRIELVKLGYVPAVDGKHMPCWCKDREFYSDAQVDGVLKAAGKWQDDFEMGKLIMI